jgi:hypothetical protein
MLPNYVQGVLESQELLESSLDHRPHIPWSSQWSPSTISATALSLDVIPSSYSRLQLSRWSGLAQTFLTLALPQISRDLHFQYEN